MSYSEGGITDKIDSLIRVFFYILMFWLPYSNAVIEICVIVSVLLWAIKRVLISSKKGKKFTSLITLFETFKPVKSYLNRTIGFFLVIALCSVGASVLFQQSLYDFITKIMEWFAIYWLVLEVFKTRKQVCILLMIGLFSATCVSIDGLLQFFILGKDIFNNHPLGIDGRVTASFSAPSGLGTYLAVMIPIALSWILISKSIKKRFLFASMTLIMITTLIFTFTRGAWIAGFLSILLFVFTYLVFKRHFELFKTLCLAGLFFIITAAFPLLLNTQTTLKMIKRSNTISWRLNVWKDSLNMIYDRPLIGHGVSTYMPIFQTYRRDSTNSPTYAHNCFVQLAAEVGLLGLAAFLWIQFRFFNQEIRRIYMIFQNDTTTMFMMLGVLCAVFSFLVHSFFDTNLYSLKLSALLWLCIGVVVKLGELTEVKAK